MKDENAPDRLLHLIILPSYFILHTFPVAGGVTLLRFVGLRSIGDEAGL